MPSYRRKKLSVKTELLHRVSGKWFNEGLCIAIIRLIFPPLNRVHFSGLGFFYRVSVFICLNLHRVSWVKDPMGRTHLQYLNLIGESNPTPRPPRLHILNSFMTLCFVHIVIPSALGTSSISRTGIVFSEYNKGVWPKIFRHNQLCFFVACNRKWLHVLCLNTLETWPLNILPVLHSANVRRVCTSLASENSKTLKEVIGYDPHFEKNVSCRK